MLVETQALRKQYGALVAVNDLDLAVREGEVFGFLGPNGAGKTTTVKMLLGLVRPTSGAARVLDNAPGQPEAMRRIGFLPEHFRFPPWLTAYNFLDMHGQLYGLSAAERRARIPPLLDRVGLGGRGRSKLGEYSKGMQQRVGLAQALLNRPALVFLDEPTSGLDPVGRYEVREIIRELRDQGVTVFLNSHYLSEVEVTCDRVGIVKGGRLVRVGELDELTGSSSEVEIRATGLSEALIAGLARWGQVSMPDRGTDGGRSRTDGMPQRILLSVEHEDVLPQVTEFLVAGGAQMYALAPQKPSLEELFMRVMSEEVA
jgi:ABC-2 type transport system ATP-binding protein